MFLEAWAAKQGPMAQAAMAVMLGPLAVIESAPLTTQAQAAAPMEELRLYKVRLASVDGTALLHLGWAARAPHVNYNFQSPLN